VAATSSPPSRARVLILIENTTVTYDRRVLKEAHALIEAGYSVSVICPAEGPEPLREELGSIHVRRYRPWQAKRGAASQVLEYLTALAKTLWLMLGMLRRPGFDIIQACNPPDLFFLIVGPFKLFGKRFVFDQHDLSPELYSTIYGSDRGAILMALRWSERRSYAMADAVIATNHTYRQLALTRGGVAEDRVFVVRNGPREAWPLPVETDPALKRGRRYLAVYIGVMGHQDGVDVLLHAISLLKHEMRFTDATFALIGAGSALEGLRCQASELDIEELVDFRGWIADDALLSQYLVTADACVCPEPSNPLNDHSTFIKVMEYMSAARPIVAFDLPETRFSAGEAAVYAPPGDVQRFAELLLDAFVDTALRERTTQAAAERLPSLLWERQVASLLAAYERVQS
jgi:glycosyltransferase involved in cell wall biosynthesis